MKGEKGFPLVCQCSDTLESRHFKKGGLEMSVRVVDLHTCKRRQLLVGSRDLTDKYDARLQSHVDYFNYLLEVCLKRVVRIQLQVNKQKISCQCKMKNPAGKPVI